MYKEQITIIHHSYNCIHNKIWLNYLIISGLKVTKSKITKLPQVVHKCVKACVTSNNVLFIYICLADKFPLVKPGTSATKGPVYSGGENVTLTMDTNYQEISAFFRVCYYNKLMGNILISCCSCDGNCEWGDLSIYSNKGYFFCELTTSQLGQYQFQIFTSNYPCYVDVGDPIDIYHTYSIINVHHLLYTFASCLGGGLLLVMTCLLCNYYIRQHAIYGKLMMFICLMAIHTQVLYFTIEHIYVCALCLWI